MFNSAIFHNAARWYCIDRRRQLLSPGVAESDETIYSRRDVVDEIRVEVERFTPQDFNNVAETREFLAAAGETARGLFIRRNLSEAEKQGISEERSRFIGFIRTLDELTASAAPSLTYRRTLASKEVEEIWSQLRSRWQITDVWFWYPLVPATPPEGVFAFHRDAFEQDHMLELLRSILRSRGVERIFEIKEGPPDVEIDVADFEPMYTGLEGYWCSSGCDWIAYASHEWTVTLGGWLLAELRLAWPEWEKWAAASSSSGEPR